MTTPDRNEAKGKLRWLLAAGSAVLMITALGGAVVWLNRSENGDSGSSQPTFTVRRGPLSISVTESGTIQPKERIVIKNELEGRTTILRLVPEGTRVQTGELLVALDTSKLEDQKVDHQIRVQNAEAAFIRAREDLEVTKNQAKSDVEKAELDKSFAEQDLEKYLEGEFPQEVMEAEARISLAQQELQRAEEKLKWSEILQGEKYLSTTELQADELAARKATLDLELARSDLQLLKDFTYKRRLAELRSDVRQSAMALERTRRKASADVVQAEATHRAKRSEHEREMSKLAKVEKEIAKARITSPTDGMVVYATSAEFRWRGNVEPLAEGQEVHQFQDLIYLPTTSAFLAQVKVHESSLDTIAPGLPVQVTVDALPGKVYRGEVAKIAPLPDPQSVFLNPDLKVYQTDIYLDDEDPELRTGMTCRVEIVVTEYEDAVYVPVQAVLKVGGTPTVYVRDGENWVERSVEVGLDNNRMIRIIRGLAANEVVLLTPPLASGEVPERGGRKLGKGGGRPPGEREPERGRRLVD
jgi:HlyD family secretion protein